MVLGSMFIIYDIFFEKNAFILFLKLVIYMYHL